MSVADTYAITVLRDAIDDMVARCDLVPLEVFTLRLFLDEAEKTAEPANYKRRITMVGRAVDFVDATR